jgi:glycerol-3-phosphate acyltransferase PlsX
MRIALDAMGGDHAPEPIVAGAVLAVAADPELHVILVGDQTQVEPALKKSGGPHERVEIFHCTQVVGMEESPVVALRKKPDNSISRSWQLLAERKVEAIVSAGNTGAVVAGGFRLRRFLKNVERPGIAMLMPTEKGPCVLLDVGANVHPKPDHLYQYGVMGSLLAKHILQRSAPKVGLMNVGSEEAKGNELAKDTNALFNASPLRDNFIGNIEGRDIHKGVADVVVCDGFVGNVVLKTCEGVFEFMMKMVAHELKNVLKNEMMLGMQALQNLVARYDYHEFGGAPLLGIDGICIICHGSSKDKAIKNALHVATRYSSAHLNEAIVRELEHKVAVAG